MSVDDKLLRGAFEAVRQMVDRPAVPDIARYAIEAPLGEGAMGVVYRARDRELNRAVALKVLKDTAGASDEVRQRFRREAQAAAGLSHPNVVAVHDLGEHDGRLYLVMELVEGRPLSALLKEGTELARALQILEKAARGVAAAHAKGIVHRDLKPSNILVGAGDEPKVADFGLAHWAEAGAALTKTGSAVGTPLYMAPEQVLGGEVTSRTDVYALGAILYEILTGRPPHAGQNLVELHARIANEDPHPPAAPSPLRAVCLKALEKDPAQRYASAEEFADDLARYLKGEPVLARPPGAGGRTVRWLRRRWAAVAVVALLVVVSAALVWTRLRGGPPEAGAVARELVSRNMRTLREGIEQWRREDRNASALVAALDDAERLLREDKLAQATGRLDRGLALMALHDRLRALRQAARERGEAAVLSMTDAAERLMRDGKLTEAAAELDRAMNRLESAQERIRQKMQRVQEAMQHAQRSGRDSAPAAQIMEQFEPLMRHGNVAEAETVLDRALQLLRD